VPEPAPPRRGAVTPKDEALFDFTERVLDLIRRTAKRKAERFAATAVKAEELARLGKFLSDLSNLKKAGTPKPTPTMRVQGNGTVSPDQSADDRKAKNAALEEDALAG